MKFSSVAEAVFISYFPFYSLTSGRDETFSNIAQRLCCKTIVIPDIEGSAPIVYFSPRKC